jgi:hypothetical protein
MDSSGLDTPLARPAASLKGVREFRTTPSPALVNAYQAFTPLPQGVRELTLIFYFPSPPVGAYGSERVAGRRGVRPN